MRAAAFTVAAAVAAPLALVATPATAQTDYGPAYRLALRCFVAASGEHDRVWGRRAFDAAMRLGQLQGFDNPRLNADFDAALADETPRVARSLGSDHRYYDQLKADCRAVGLLD